MRDESESRILIYLNLNVCKWQKGICWVLVKKGDGWLWSMLKGGRVMWTLGSISKSSFLLNFWIVFEEKCTKMSRK